jgi:hypothetical protein
VAAPLRDSATYADRRRYTSAVANLDAALQLASVPHPGVRLRVADVAWNGERPQSSASLLRVSSSPGPFDGYYQEELLPRLKDWGATHVGISLSFTSQAYAAFRLARLLRDHLPHVTLWLGGPLPACWAAAGVPVACQPFTLFHRVLPGTVDEMWDLAVELGGHGAVDPNPLAPPLADVNWGAYLSPLPVVPVALARGCYWRRCTFCPDHLHPRHARCGQEALARWLRGVAARFPGGAVLHVTDSSVAPSDVERLCRVIRDEQLPLSWHAFVRMERCFHDEDFVRLLRDGGCAMLQFGLESASPRILGLLDKGVSPEQARRVLRTTAHVGIRNLVYILLGVPTETDADREATLRFLAEEAENIHDVNAALLNLPRGSPMHQEPGRFGITQIRPFGPETDLSLFDDFGCGASHPRLEARRWLGRRFFRHDAIRAICGDLNDPFKANHACFLPPPARRHGAVP